MYWKTAPVAVTLLNWVQPESTGAHSIANSPGPPLICSSILPSGRLAMVSMCGTLTAWTVSTALLLVTVPATLETTTE